jgi:hypothetical protein
MSESSSYAIVKGLLRDEPDSHPFLIAAFQLGSRRCRLAGNFGEAPCSTLSSVMTTGRGTSREDWVGSDSCAECSKARMALATRSSTRPASAGLSPSMV